MARRWLLYAPVMLALFAVFIAMGGLIVYAAWNWLMPQLFGLPAITFWQALGLLVLCRVLFGGIGPRRMHHARSRVHRKVQRRIAERWATMTPEERARLRDRLREKFGFDPLADEPGGSSRTD